MLQRTATLEADEGDGGDHAANPQAQQKAGGVMKFAYKTGSRPLEGYAIKRGVGVGGFGEVYFAVTDAGKEVALKRVQRNLDIEVRGVSQCLNLKHVNLISLYDLKYDDEGQAWVVMEYVPGESLKDVIDRNPNGVPPDDAERWFRGIAEGVMYLHDRGIVHRDLKPGNIFDDDSVVKIGDYGLSKFISTSRRSGQTESVGTFHYMAPEIGKGNYGKEIDVYALGIILFEMLTGEVPFDGESSQEIIMKHLTDDPDLSGIRQPYRNVIQRALRKDPEKRFSNVREMLDALDGADDSASASGFVLESLVDSDEPIYIGDDEEDEPNMVFGPVRHNEIVQAEAVPPVRCAGPSAAGSAAPSRTRNVAQAVARQPARLAGRLRHSEMSGSAKAAILLAVVLVVAFNPWLLPLAAVVGGIYLVYWCVRALSCKLPAQPETSHQANCSAGGEAFCKTAAREAIRRKPFSERVAELSGSMLFSGMISAVLCLVFLLIEGDKLDGNMPGWSLYTWLTVSSVAGSWILLTLGKFWEGNDGDHFRRRFVMLIAGLAFGAAAFGASQLLMVDVQDQDRMTAHAFSDDQVAALYSTDGSPLLAAYLIYFAGLFVILRWWAQADPLRRTRLSLWATGVCVLWAWIVHMFCPFPQPWGLMLAAAISVSVQMSAPWVNSKQRTTIGQTARIA